MKERGRKREYEVTWVRRKEIWENSEEECAPNSLHQNLQISKENNNLKW